MHGRSAWWGAMVAITATGANSVHGIAHAGQGLISLPAWQLAYVTVVIYVAPIAAVLLLRTGFRRTGAWMLLSSMAGAFVFGLVYHFLVPGPDNVFTLHTGAWRAPFEGSAVLVSGMIGCLVGTRLLGEPSRSADGEACPPALTKAPRGASAGPR